MQPFTQHGHKKSHSNVN